MTDSEGEVRELTLAEVRRMRPASEVEPDLVEAMKALRNPGGRPKAATPKVLISFRIDAALIERIKATGRGYNGRVEKALEVAFGQIGEFSLISEWASAPKRPKLETVPTQKGSKKRAKRVGMG